MQYLLTYSIIWWTYLFTGSYMSGQIAPEISRNVIHISTHVSTLSTVSGTTQPRFTTGTAHISHLTVTPHYIQQRFWSSIHVIFHGQQFTLYCFPAKILWMQMWTKPWFPLPYFTWRVNTEAMVLASWWCRRKVFRLHNTRTLGYLLMKALQPQFTQRLVWLMSHPVCAEVNNAMQQLTGVLYNTSEQHKA